MLCVCTPPSASHYTAENHFDVYILSFAGRKLGSCDEKNKEQKKYLSGLKENFSPLLQIQRHHEQCVVLNLSAVCISVCGRLEDYSIKTGEKTCSRSECGIQVFIKIITMCFVK